MVFNSVNLGVPLVNTVVGVDLGGIFAQDAEKRNAMPHSASAADPRAERARLDTALNVANTVHLAKVHYAIPGSYSYAVILEGTGTVLVCSDVTASALSMSARVSHIYPVGSRVIVLQATSQYGVILGAVPQALEDVNFNFSTLTSGVGSFHVSQRQYIANVLSDKTISKGVPSFIADRVSDICAGDYGITNAMGGGFFTGLFETSIRQALNCGIWMFDIDRLLRIIGKAVQTYSAIHEEYQGLDEYEPHVYRGYALYPWEALGYYSKPETLYTNSGSITNQEGKGIYEPQEKDITPFYRYQQFSGYIGQGALEIISIPPPNATGANTLSAKEVPPTVAKRQMFSDGTVLVESSKAIHFVKHPNIRSFKRVEPIESGSGDSLTEFRAEGVARPAGLCAIDAILWAARKASPATFREHKKDFIEAENKLFDTDVSVGSLSDLKTQPMITSPETKVISVDPNNPNAEYSGTRAGISIFDGGAVVIYGSCGEEIRLAGGNIHLSCPGDIIMMPARSAVTMAGDDVIQKAKNSVDITAVSKDVRIKADANLDVVGGMSGNGRTLIQNMSYGTPTDDDVHGYEGEQVKGKGLWLRSGESGINQVAPRIYLKSAPAMSGDSGIILDGDQSSVILLGKEVGFQAWASIYGTIVPYSRTASVTVGGADVPAFVLTTGLFETSMDVVSLKSIRAKAGIGTDGDVVAASYKLIASPSITEEMVESWKDFIVGNPGDSTGAGFKTGIMDVTQNHYVDTYWGESQLMGDLTLQGYHFSFRTSDQCGATRFIFESPYWMTLFGSEAELLETWNEQVYNYQNSVSQLSFPGYAAWTTGQVVPNSSMLFDSETGNDRDDTNGETATDIVVNTPEQFYRIINPF
jgi:hypothetical protein